MQDAPLQLALIVSGAALLAMGLLRLAGGWFQAMPRIVAAATCAMGVGVVVFGVVLARQPGTQPVEPRLQLEPQSPDATTEPLPATTVSGLVRRAGGNGVARATVVLASPSEGDEVIRSEAVAGPDGRFRFDNVRIGGPYVLTTRFDGTDFGSGPFFVPAEELEIVVAPVTGDAGALAVRASSLALIGDDRGVQAVQALTLSNDGPEAFDGTIELPLLAGATAIEATRGLDGARLGARDGALVSRAPVLPGDTQIAYTYVVPAAPGGFGVDLRLALPTERFDVLVGGELRLAADELATDEVTLGGRRYVRATWSDLEGGARVRARVGAPAPSRIWQVAGLAGAGLLAAAVVAWPLLRRRRRRGAVEAAA